MTAAAGARPTPTLPYEERRPSLIGRSRATAVYVLVVVIGAAAFLYPFWLPSTALQGQSHAGDAPMVAAIVGALAVAAVALETSRSTMSGATVAVLGMLSAIAGLLKLLDLPQGGSGLFFLVILAGAAFGPRFGLLLGLTSFAVAAVLSSGVGPWLPFQMLALSWMGAGAGFLGRWTRRIPPWFEVGALAVYGWIWGFVYGAILNLWFWPFQRAVDRTDAALTWAPGMSFADTLHHYWSFYVATSFGWDAAGALANAVIILVVGRPLMRTMRRYAARLEPVAVFER